MSNKLIMMAEDDSTNITILKKLLVQDYELLSVENGEQCLSDLDKRLTETSTIPDLLLLDINMPGIDGIEVCKKIRTDSRYDFMPIIFISALESDQEQLLGYEVGGDDYVTKPFNKEELLHKIKLNISKRQSKEELQQAADETMSVFLTELTDMGELGDIINSIRNSYGLKSIEELVETVFNLFSQSYYLNSSLLFKSDNGSQFYFHDKVTRPLEKEVLSLINNSSNRMISFGQRIGFNSEQGKLTILIRNMPADEEKLGRLRDHFLILIDALEIRFLSLEEELQVIKQEQYLLSLLKEARTSLTEINNQKQYQHQQNRQNFINLNEKINSFFITLGMDEAQEKGILSLINDTHSKLMNLSLESKKIDDTFNHTMRHFLS